jgi:hypothetical protein
VHTFYEIIHVTLFLSLHGFLETDDFGFDYGRGQASGVGAPVVRVAVDRRWESLVSPIAEVYTP